MTIRLPRWAPGQRIGLMGGSFNPPHEGHLLASRLALQRLRLDRLWWLVTPGNPLKDARALPPLEERLATARTVASHPRIDVTGLEAETGTRYSFDTLQWLKRRLPGVHFVWIMGADNLANFHLWRNWREIAALVPIAVIDRPGASATGPFVQRLAAHRLPDSSARRLPLTEPPAWIFLRGLKSPVSSTALRRAGG